LFNGTKTYLSALQLNFQVVLPGLHDSYSVQFWRSYGFQFHIQRYLSQSSGYCSVSKENCRQCFWYKRQHPFFL